ncbi:MAG: pilus assembly protein PilM [Deltaproteobacteria bacterium]|nr:pilus assembly protein PilM [Deltaproteobacteria bacterium]
MKYLGLDMGATHLKYVELTRAWQGLRITGWGVFPLAGGLRPEDRRERGQQLRQIQAEGLRNGGVFFSSLAADRTLVYRLSLPFADRKKNFQVVKYELEPLLPFPVDQVVVDFHASPDSSGGALVFAVRKEELADHLSALQEAGLDPEGVVPEGLALFWAVQHLEGKGSSQARALLDLGAEKSTLIIWRPDRLGLVRSIPFGTAREEEAESEPALRPFAQEVERTLSAYESEAEAGAVGELLLTGGAAEQAGSGEAWAEGLRRPVRPLLGGSISPLLAQIPREHRSDLMVALGCALGGSIRESERVNFRQEEFGSLKRARRIKSRTVLLVTYGVVLGLLGIAVLAAQYFLQERRYGALRAEIRREFLQAVPGTKKVVNEVQQLKNIVREEKARVDALGGRAGAGALLEILRELTLIMEPSLKVRVTELILDGESVEMNGEADSFETVSRLKAGLDRSALFKGAQLKAAQASNLPNVIEFRIHIKRGT